MYSNVGGQKVGAQPVDGMEGGVNMSLCGGYKSYLNHFPRTIIACSRKPENESIWNAI